MLSSEEMRVDYVGKAEGRTLVVPVGKHVDWFLVTTADASRGALEHLSVALLQNEMPVSKPSGSWACRSPHCRATRRNCNRVYRSDFAAPQV